MRKKSNNVNNCPNSSGVSGRESEHIYDFSECKFHRSAGAHLALHCNGHHWRRRQLFYKLPTAVTPAASMVCPARQAAADLSCPGMPIAQVGFSAPWHYIEIFPKPRSFNGMPSKKESMSRAPGILLKPSLSPTASTVCQTKHSLHWYAQVWFSMPGIILESFLNLPAAVPASQAWALGQAQGRMASGPDPGMSWPLAC